MTVSKRATTRNNKTTTEEVSSPPPHKEKVRASPGSAETKKTKKSDFKDISVSLPDFIAKKISKQADELNVGQPFMIYLNSLMRENEVNTNYQVSLRYGDIYLLSYIASLKSMTTERYLKTLIERDIRENFKDNFLNTIKERKEAKS